MEAGAHRSVVRPTGAYPRGMVATSVVLDALAGQRYSPALSLPSSALSPGIYAIFGDEAAWSDLGLGEPVADLPLYVGKAEDSLAKRDAKEHFSDGYTGRSTVRRSVAALLRQDLGLTGVPRNLACPANFANFALMPADDAKVTLWMKDRLQLALWPSDGSELLKDVEEKVLRRLDPPLNLTHVNHRWKARIMHERSVMARQAEAWRA